MPRGGEILAFLAVIGFIVFVIWAGASQNSACAAKGGVLVRGLIGFQCVSAAAR